MSSLSNVIRQEQSFEGQIEASFHSLDNVPRYLGWKQLVFEELETYLACLNIESFHHVSVEWIRTETESPDLEKLCVAVISSLRTTIQSTRYIQQWAGLSNPTSRDQKLGKSLTRQTLRCIISALKQFEFVSGNDELLEEPFRSMVIRYLRKVMSLSTVMGQLFGYDCWYGYLDEFEEQNMDTFVFDCEDDYRKRSDTSLGGVIADHRAVPRSFLPVEPHPPIVYHNSHPYGASILRNNPD